MDKSKTQISLAAICTFAFFKFVFPVFWPTVIIEFKTFQHKGWDGARDALKQRYAASVKDVGMEKDIEERYLNCVTDKAITYLNNTTCKYSYNKKTTSEAEHMKEQDRCFKEIGYAQEEEKIDKICADEIIASLK